MVCWDVKNTMNKEPITPHHINATSDDLAGNNGIGRYILLPGSDGRAKAIAEHFNEVSVKHHPRGHHLYLGTLTNDKKSIDVAVISSGMGCPSMEIILHELFHLGAKRFLRVGTAGSLQPNFVKVGNIVNVQASVRDEHTTTDYMPLAVPAIASIEFPLAILQAAKKCGVSEEIHTGIVHCKSSLYAREFGAGPKSQINKDYVNLLTQCGVLASEMETAALFIQTQLYNYQLTQEGNGPNYRVLSGAILGIISASSNHFSFSVEESKIDNKLIEVALETIKILSSSE